LQQGIDGVINIALPISDEHSPWSILLDSVKRRFAKIKFMLMDRESWHVIKEHFGGIPKVNIQAITVLASILGWL